MLAHGVTMGGAAVKGANLDVGARTWRNQPGSSTSVHSLGPVRGVEEYRGSGRRHGRSQEPIRVGDVGKVGLGPALRRGALDDARARSRRGTTRGSDPMAAMEAVRTMAKSSPACPADDARHGGAGANRTISRLMTTLETLSGSRWSGGSLVTVVVVVLEIMGASRSLSLLVSALLPMRGARPFRPHEARRHRAVAWPGIAIAMGRWVDVGIVLVENIVHLTRPRRDADRAETCESLTEVLRR